MDNREILDNMQDALECVKTASGYLREINPNDELCAVLEGVQQHLHNRVTDLEMFIEAQEAAEQRALEREYWQEVALA